MTVNDTTTTLHALGADQAALHGLLRRVENFGLEVIEVRLEPGERP